MSTLIACATVVIVVAVGCWLVWKTRPSQPDAASYQVMVGLHTIRRRLDAFQFKMETRRDAAEVRRQLRADLRELDEWERG